jgi:hypothetical protein
MDNRINEIRREISALRDEMIVVEGVVRDQLKHGHDCAEAAHRLLVMRSEMTLLIGQWKAAGGSERLPDVREHLKRQPVARPKD